MPKDIKDLIKESMEFPSMEKLDEGLMDSIDKFMSYVKFPMDSRKRRRIQMAVDKLKSERGKYKRLQKKSKNWGKYRKRSMKEFSDTIKKKRAKINDALKKERDIFLKAAKRPKLKMGPFEKVKQHEVDKEVSVRIGIPNVIFYYLSETGGEPFGITIAKSEESSLEEPISIGKIELSDGKLMSIIEDVELDIELGEYPDPEAALNAIFDYVSKYPNEFLPQYLMLDYLAKKYKDIVSNALSESLSWLKEELDEGVNEDVSDVAVQGAKVLQKGKEGVSSLAVKAGDIARKAKEGLSTQIQKMKASYTLATFRDDMDSIESEAKAMFARQLAKEEDKIFDRMERSLMKMKRFKNIIKKT